MHYLARWRMALAANLLRGSALTLTRVAEEVGYETDAAFSRAFRREYGMPPAAWRRLHAPASPGLSDQAPAEEPNSYEAIGTFMT
jgi:AraC-like DNA-binding protein